MNATAEQLQPLQVPPAAAPRPRPGPTLVPLDGGRGAVPERGYLTEVNAWPAVVWSVWDQHAAELVRDFQLGRSEAELMAYVQLLRGKVPLPALTVHPLPDGRYPRWARRLPATITWVSRA